MQRERILQLAALYIGYEDIWQAVDRLAGILESGSWNDEKFILKKGTVT
jgi:kynureninase